jgi:hypothetical protein
MRLSFRSLPLVAVVMFAAGCANTGVAPVNQIPLDKLGYLRDNFGADKVQLAITLQLSSEQPADEKFQRMELKMRMDEDGKSSAGPLDFSTTVINLGRGLRQELWEATSNGKPHLTEFKLSHVGLITLKQEVGYYASPAPLLSTNSKTISFENSGIAQPKDGAEYLHYNALDEPNPTSQLDASWSKCISGKRYAASTIHPNLTGQAIDLSCDSIKERALRLKVSYAYLLDYGFALRKSVVAGDAKQTYRVTALELK